MTTSRYPFENPPTIEHTPAVQPAQPIDLPSFQEREGGALFLLCALAVAPFILVALPLLFLSAWWTVAGNHDTHQLFWGWLSNPTYYKNGSVKGWGISHGVPLYYLALGSLCLFYQLAEGVNGLFQVFRKALS